jgi:hypothetical protein
LPIAVRQVGNLPHDSSTSDFFSPDASKSVSHSFSGAG